MSVASDTASSMSQLKEIGHCGQYVFTLSDLGNTLTCLWGSHLDIVHTCDVNVVTCHDIVTILTEIFEDKPLREYNWKERNFLDISNEI